MKKIRKYIYLLMLGVVICYSIYALVFLKRSCFPEPLRMWYNTEYRILKTQMKRMEFECVVKTIEFLRIGGGHKGDPLLVLDVFSSSAVIESDFLVNKGQFLELVSAEKWILRVPMSLAGKIVVGDSLLKPKGELYFTGYSNNLTKYQIVPDSIPPCD